MATVGYARVSSVGQSLDVQLEKLRHCDNVFKEKRSGVDSGRPALKQCLDFLREGDTLDRGVKFGRKRELTEDRVKEIRDLRESGETVPSIVRQTGFS